jgi:hypothetical protein
VEGEPYGDIKKSFLTVIKKSGIVDFRFHDLRYTFVSHLPPDHKKRAVDISGKRMDTSWTADTIGKKPEEISGS